MRTLVVGFGRVVVAILLLGALVGCQGGGAGGNVLTQDLSEPLGSATAARIDINCGAGNLTIDRLAGGEPLLAGGTLQYSERQGPPSRTRASLGDQATLTLSGQGTTGPGLRLPWAACTAALDWQVHLNPSVRSDITAHSDGGNLTLNLAGMAVGRVAADTGGGNIDMALPEGAAGLSVTARTGAGTVTVEVGSGTTGSNTINATSGAGNVTVRVPGGVAALVHATSGAGKVIVGSRFSRVDANTYRSPGYDTAANRVEITVHSGAGNVSVESSQGAASARPEK